MYGSRIDYKFGINNQKCLKTNKLFIFHINIFSFETNWGGGGADIDRTVLID